MSKILLAIGMCFFCTAVEAREYRLFKEGQPGIFVANYQETVNGIKETLKTAGTAAEVVIVFSNGEKKHIDGYLGEGSVTLVLSSRDRAIRIPAKASAEARKQINDYYQAWTILHSAKCKDDFLFNIYEKLDGEFLVVDKLQILLNYETFKTRYKTCFVDEADFDINEYGADELDKECNYCEILETNENLVKFAYLTSEFRGIQDISPANIVYVQNPNGKRRWVLLDFALPVTKFQPPNAEPAILEHSALTPIGIPKIGTFAIGKSIARATAAGRSELSCDSQAIVSRIEGDDNMFHILRQLCTKWRQLNP